MLKQPLNLSSGSITPQLEGAPCSQIHDSRIASPQIAPISDMTASAEEKGQLYEAAVDTNCSFESTTIS